MNYRNTELFINGAWTSGASGRTLPVVNPASAKLFIDGVEVAVTASPKVLDATDFSYTRATPFPPSSDHTYAIEVKDTNGRTVADASTFRTIYYAILILVVGSSLRSRGSTCWCPATARGAAPGSGSTGPPSQGPR